MKDLLPFGCIWWLIVRLRSKNEDKPAVEPRLYTQVARRVVGFVMRGLVFIAFPGSAVLCTYMTAMRTNATEQVLCATLCSMCEETTLSYAIHAHAHAQASL